MVNQKLCYLVKWEGFGVEHSSWEPWDNIHAPELVADFYQRHTLVLLATSVWSNFAPFLSIQCQVVTALKGGWMLGDAPLHRCFLQYFSITSVYSSSSLLAQDRVHLQLRYQSPMITSPFHHSPSFFIILLSFIILLF